MGSVKAVVNSNENSTTPPKSRTVGKVEVVAVAEKHEGQRLDNFLIRQLKGVPRSRIYRLIRRGEVRVNKKRCKPERKLEIGDQVRIPPYSGADISEPGRPSAALQELLLQSVLYEDEQFMVINKPSGLAVHGGSGINLGLIEAMRQLKAEWAGLELAHRLDRNTSGCLVISKQNRFLKHIQEELKARRVKKLYLALVFGSWPDSLQQVDAPLQKELLSSGDRIVRVVAAGKPAFTEFRVRQRFQGATLIEASPATGRTHQIRVHCQYSGHPIVADNKYTLDKYMEKNAESPLWKPLKGVKSLCLHASKIHFSVPNRESALEVEAPMDQQMERVLDNL